MTISELLAELKRKDVRLRIERGDLRVDAPKGVLTSELIAFIRENKLRILDLFAESPEAQSAIPVRSTPRDEFPLSFSQHAFFMLAQVDPGNYAYNIHSVRRVTGEIDLNGLAASVGDVVARHESLRTRFELRDNGVAVQIIEPPNCPAIRVVDLSHLPEHLRELQWTDVLSRERACTFKLDTIPLFRVELIRLAPTTHLFVLSMHHIISDATSLDIFYRDLLLAYGKRRRGAAPDFEPLPIQYGDYSDWQRQRFEGGALAAEPDFWRKELAQMPRLLDGISGVNSIGSEHATSVRVVLPPDLDTRLRRLSETQGATLFAVVLSAYQYLLGRYFRSRDIPVIVPYSARLGSDTERLIGLFVNGLVVRTRFRPGMSTAELIRAVRSKTAEVLSHREFSIESLEGLFRLKGHPEPTLATMSRIGFNYIVVPERPRMEIDGLTIEPLEIDRTQSVFDLMLNVTDSGNALALRWEFKSNLLPSDLFEQFSADLIRVLGAMTETETAPLDGLRSLSSGVEWLRLDPEKYERVDVLSPRARYLNRIKPGKHRVLGYTLDLSSSNDLQFLKDGLKALITLSDVLRSTTIESPFPWLDREYTCISRREQSDFPLEEILGEVPQLLYEETATVHSQHPWRNFICVLPSGRRQYVFFTSEALLGVRAIAAHRDTVSGILNGSFDINRFEEAVAQDSFGKSEDLDVQSARITSSPPAAFRKPEPMNFHRDIPGFGQIAAWCEANQFTLSHLFQSIYGLLLGLHAQAEQPVLFWRHEINEQNEVLESRAYYPPAPDTTIFDALRSALRSGPDPADPKAGEIRFVFEESAFPEVRTFASPASVYLSLHFGSLAATLSISFDASEFSGERFLDRMITLVSQIVDSPLSPWSSLNLLSDLDAAQLAVLNATRRHWPPAESVIDLFKEQVAVTPEATAINCNGRTLLYREVDALSDKIAAGLGIGRKIVGVCLTRSEMLPVVLMGVMKTGAAYLPLDPDFPPERLRFSIEKTGVSAILAESGTRSVLPSDSHILLIEDLVRASSVFHALALPNSQDLAYVMFTSGSTGQPKGVCIRHGSVVNLLRSMAEHTKAGRDDVFVAVTTPAFDISVLEFFLPLSTGGRLIVADQEVIRSGDRLGALLDESGATMLQATPSGWRMLLDSGWRGRHELRALCGGEQLPVDLAIRLKSRVREMWNLYGPTETTIWSAIFHVHDEVTGPIPIGRPIANTEIFIVDGLRRLLPPGIPGELCIAGEGVSPQYWGEPSLTAERFVDLTTPDRRTIRAYCTGDRACLRSDSELEFQGRLDRQIKIRGYRVEPHEIEARMLAFKGVSQAVITVVDVDDQPALAGYYTTSADVRPEELRAFIAQTLPGYMVPQFVVQLAAVPQTPNGKIDYKALPGPVRQTWPSTFPPSTEIERTLYSIWSAALGHSAFGINDNFFDIGGHSLLLLRIQQRIANEIEPAIRPIDLFTYPSISGLAARIGSLRSAAQPKSRQKTRGLSQVAAPDNDIAVIGMSVRFPGSPTIQQFWENLILGSESISELTREELRAEGVPGTLLDNSAYRRAASILSHIEWFDSEFFNIPARIAALTDPQQRILLECVYEALEDAGYNPFNVPGETGVFTGIGFPSYLVNNILPNRAILNISSPLEVLYANDRDYASTLISYKLNFTGPSLTLATACSTSLVAVHYACRSLIAGECDTAIAGGAKIQVPQKVGYIHQDGGIFSNDGHCRPFDEKASGTVFGNGVGVVVLKRLADALRDSDSIYAVVKGSAVNNDGASKVGYTGPGVRGQSRVIAKAYASAGIDPDSIQYVEMHGTGTRLGDPIEVEALTTAFREYTDRREFCAIGSVKGNIGHLDPAAGIAGFIKAVLAIDRGRIPPSAQFRAPNSHIAFSQTPFYVNTKPVNWQEGQPKRAAVSSFGIGGTNAHLVLEQAPLVSNRASGAQDALLVISGRTPEAFAAARDQIAHYLGRHPTLNMRDVAYTLQTGRPAFRYRGTAVVSNLAEWEQRLSSLTAEVVSGQPPGLVFLFPGNAVHRPNAIRSFYVSQPVFHEQFDTCAALVRDRGWNLVEEASFESSTDNRKRQVILFAAQYALARLLLSIGLKPVAMLGNGIGHYAAVCASGEMPLEDGFQLAETASLLEHKPLPAFHDRIKQLRGLYPSLQFLMLAEGELVPGIAASRIASTPELLQVLGSLWVQGHTIDWEAMYLESKPQKVHLPAYPFQRSRHWIEPNREKKEPSATERKENLEEWLYEPSWKRKLLDAGGGKQSEGALLVFGLRNELTHEIQRQAAAQGRRVLMVYPGWTYHWDKSTDTFEICLEETHPFKKLSADISLLGVSEVIYLWTAVEPLSLSDAARFGFYCPFDLIRAFAAQNLPARFLLLTIGCQNVTGAENIQPESALTVGPVLTLPRELPGLAFAQADLEAAALEFDCEDLARQLFTELRLGLPDPIVAYRAKARWIRYFDPLRLPSGDERGQVQGACWIAGGLGGVGYEIARSMILGGKIDFILSGRSDLRDNSDASRRQNERLRALQAIGGRVVYLQADVGDRNAMSRAFEQAIANFGNIACFIHAAAVPDSGLAMFRQRDKIQTTLAPKVEGALVVSDLCANYGVHSLVFMSSITAITGNIGQLAYTSGNAFLDVLAESERRKGRRVYSINWDVWSETGMARDATLDSSLKNFQEARLALGIRSDEGVALLRRILTGPPRQVVISTTPIEPRLAVKALTEQSATFKWHQERPTSLGQPVISAKTETEHRLIELWRDSFGLAEIGTQDDFFELGGNSLQAIELISKMEKAFQRKIDPNALLDYSNVQALAAMIDGETADALQHQSPLIVLRSGADEMPPLVLIHPVGGQLYHYRALVQALPIGRKVYGVKSPPPQALARVECVEALAAEYIRYLNEADLVGHCCLAGSSFGGTIAFEMARQMSLAGNYSNPVYLLDTPGGEQVPHDFRDDVDILSYFASELPAEFELTAENLRALPPEEVRSYFRARAEHVSPQLHLIDAGALDDTLEIFKQNMRMMKAYRPKPYPGEIYFFKAMQRRERFDPPDPESAWSELCSNFTLIETPGNHFTMHALPHVATLAFEFDRVLPLPVANSSRQ